MFVPPVDESIQIACRYVRGDSGAVACHREMHGKAEGGQAAADNEPWQRGAQLSSQPCEIPQKASQYDHGEPGTDRRVYCRRETEEESAEPVATGAEQTHHERRQRQPENSVG